MHHFSERRGVQAHAEHCGCDQRQHPEFTPREIRHLANMVVANLAEDHALVHPQRVRRAEDQRETRAGRRPEHALFHRCKRHREFTDEARCARQPGVCHAKQHEQRSELRHDVHHAAVIRNVAAVQAVIHYANAEEHRGRNEAVRDHLHQAAFDAQRAALPSHEQEEAERDKTHVRDRRIRDQFFHVGLDERDKADVDNRNERNHDDERCQQMRGVGDDRQDEAQEAIGTELQRNRRQND